MELTPIGAYECLALLGRGGMGAVYRARHSRTKQPVALKTVSVSDPRQLEAIRREVQALTRVRHPGIVRIHDHGIHEGRPWYAMDLLEGETLRQLCTQMWSQSDRFASFATNAAATERLSSSGSSALPAATSRAAHASGPSAHLVPAAAGQLEIILPLMARICRTLAFLHGEGFVNGDLKPDNVLIVDEEPVIIDFGLSRHHPGGSSREALDLALGAQGTALYMSPEQIRGELLDARSDLYSLGCILYELLSGRAPFEGPSRSVMLQHLSAAPQPLSVHVADVPEPIERLVLGLLAKDPAQRPGYADEVASELSRRSSGINLRAEIAPEPLPYLYRPRFIGRHAEQDRIQALLEAWLDSRRGGFVVVSGESGVGKTRLIMESVRRVAKVSQLTVSGSASRVGTAASPPLHALMPLLQAIADRCLAEGAAATERLLGARRAVLMEYATSFAQLPGLVPLEPVMELPAPQARQRLFACLRESIAAFAQDRPLLWVIDDLGEADELSLDFMAELASWNVGETGLLVMATVRSEESGDRITKLSTRPGVTHLELGRLDAESVAFMVADMLALREPEQGFVSFIARETEGNPFFVSEYLRTAIQARVLFRDATHVWHLEPAEAETGPRYVRLQQPRSMREVIQRRLDTISSTAYRLGLAAATLGREAPVELVQRVALLDEASFLNALHELEQRHVCEPSRAGELRFAHDKLREVLYASASALERRELHRRAAQEVEARFANSEAAPRHWAVLGHHFAAAGQAVAALRYFMLSADYAKNAGAHGDALALYRRAVDEALNAGGQAASTAVVAAYEGLADLLALGGQREEARRQYETALQQSPPAELVARARLLRKQGKTWETAHHHAQSLELYNAASAALGSEDASWDSLQRHEWIEIRADQLWVSYWLSQVPLMQSLLAELRPAIERWGSPAQRVRFFQGQMMMNLRRDRFTVNEETAQFALQALESCRAGSITSQLPMMQFGYGFALLLRNSVVESVAALEEALALSVKAGDTGTQARCLTYLAVAHRMLGHVAEAADFNARNTKVCVATGTNEYLACARGNDAWLALHRGDWAAAMACADEALALWQGLALKFPFQWLALIPRLRACLQRDDVAGAVESARALLEPTQQALPGQAVDALAQAATALASEDTARARTALERAIASFQSSGHA